MIESISGIRGKVEEFSEEIVTQYAIAVTHYLKEIKNAKIVFGTDTRPSGKLIKEIFTSVLTSAGVSVIDVRILPTPTIQILTKHFKTDLGIMVTASHNPIEWNGIKFIHGDGRFLFEDELSKLLQFKSQIALSSDTHAVLETPSHPEEIHISKILEEFDLSLITSAKLHVAVDVCNGAGYKIIPALLKILGVEITLIHDNPKKPFERVPEPTADSLKKLCETVKKKECAIGFAVDPDADRLSLVDENGNAMGEESTLLLAFYYALEKFKWKNAKCVTNLSTTGKLDWLAKKYNAEIFRSKVGEINVTQKILESKALFGGEGNGGVIFPKIGLGRDSLVGIVLILEMLAILKKPLSEINSIFPKTYMIKDKITLSSRLTAHGSQFFDDLIEKFKREYPDAQINRLDGVKIIIDDLTWVHIRKSNTEDVIRVIYEAPGKEQTNEIGSIIKELLALGS
ncbi:hypothetical protein ACFL56_01665 [Candidatus Margulisiibacteriota bacterium]